MPPHHIVMKMDVEGAEWESVPALPDEALQRIDQIVFELHGVKEQQYLDTVRRLKQFFYVAHLHINNFSCEPGHEPFGGWAYEVPFVNKKLTGIDPSRKEVGEVPAITKNHPTAPDCQGRTVRKLSAAMWNRRGVRATVVILFVVVAGLVVRNQVKV